MQHDGDPKLSRPQSLPRPRFFFGLIVVACGSALFAIAFRAAIERFFVHIFHAPNVLGAFRALPWWARIVAPTAGGLAAGAASSMAARAPAGHSVADVMEAVVVGERHISLRGTLWKALGSYFAIVTGGSLGREGPLIQFGGAFGSAVGGLLRVRRRRALIAAGTAAGFAAAYNTPFAAVLFVIEGVIGFVELEFVLPAICAAAIATALTRATMGEGPLYGARAFAMRSTAELAVHLVLGLAAGIVGVGFMLLLSRGERVFARVHSRALRASLGGAAVGAIACVLPEVTGNGYEAIALILGGSVTLPVVALLLVAKPIATSSSVGSGSPGGVFTPSLFLGAALGALTAAAAARVAPAGSLGPAGGYALVGMAAVVAATTHAPLMAAVLVFEVTGDYAIVLPLLLATSAATAVARSLRRTSIYTEELERRGIRWGITITRLDDDADDERG